VRGDFFSTLLDSFTAAGPRRVAHASIWSLQAADNPLGQGERYAMTVRESLAHFSTTDVRRAADALARPCRSAAR
jgi:hypothetical protein